MGDSARVMLFELFVDVLPPGALVDSFGREELRGRLEGGCSDSASL